MKNKIWNKTFILGKIAEKFLDHLVDALEEGYILSRKFSDIKGTFIPFEDELEEEKDWFRKQREKRRIIYELKRRRLISEEKIGEKIFYILTDKGSAELTRRKIFNCTKYMKKGKLCLVVFDIPESQRHIRSMFRKFLKEADFKYIQQSVWATDKDLVEPFKDFIKTIEADHWVNVFIVNKVILMPSKSKASLTIRRLTNSLK